MGGEWLASQVYQPCFMAKKQHLNKLSRQNVEMTAEQVTDATIVWMIFNVQNR